MLDKMWRKECYDAYKKALKYNPDNIMVLNNWAYFLALEGRDLERALAMSKGAVLNKFQNMRLTATEVVGFANVLDYYDYLGDKDITVQTLAGLTYVKDFLGYRTLFLLSDTDIPRGMVIAVPVENIDLYYIDPSNSDFAQLDLNYTVEGDTNLIGFHAEGNYSTAVGDVFAKPRKQRSH